MIHGRSIILDGLTGCLAIVFFCRRHQAKKQPWALVNKIFRFFVQLHTLHLFILFFPTLHTI